MEMNRRSPHRFAVRPFHEKSTAGLSRRELLRRSANGFGAVALSALLRDPAYSKGVLTTGFHHRPRAKRVIFLYMDGGVSQVDSFDPKPRLARDHGRRFGTKIEPTQFDNIGSTLKSPWEFRPYGQDGTLVSDMFPHIGRCIDDICLVRSMVSEFSEHQTANYFLHTCFGVQGRPSIGAWVGYGLGTENRSLPGYIVINGGLIPSGGLDNFGNSFLPATYQGTIFRPGDKPVANIEPRELTAESQLSKLRLLRKLDRGVLERFGESDALESAIANYEVAYRMQMSVPDVVSVNSESHATRKLYGLESDFEPTRIFATQCLVARRMVERGVRFVELTCPRIQGCDRWDAHVRLRKNHGDNARAVDQPIAGLITDLKNHGLLDETLIVWSGEFGRTPFAQGSDGRDHSPFGFSIFLAGGGVKSGFVYGATDEFGYRAIENKVSMYDLHATILHLLGLDHERLTYRFSGRDMRLTDVHGEVVHDLIA